MEADKITNMVAAFDMVNEEDYNMKLLPEQNLLLVKWAPKSSVCISSRQGLLSPGLSKASFPHKDMVTAISQDNLQRDLQKCANGANIRGFL